MEVIPKKCLHSVPWIKLEILSKSQVWYSVHRRVPSPHCIQSDVLHHCRRANTSPWFTIEYFYLIGFQLLQCLTHQMAWRTGWLYFLIQCKIKISFVQLYLQRHVHDLVMTYLTSGSEALRILVLIKCCLRGGGQRQISLVHTFVFQHPVSQLFHEAVNYTHRLSALLLRK